MTTQHDALVKRTKLCNNTKDVVVVGLINYESSDVNSNKEDEVPFKTITRDAVHNNVFDLSRSLSDIPIPLRQILYKCVCLQYPIKNCN